MYIGIILTASKLKDTKGDWLAREQSYTASGYEAHCNNEKCVNYKDRVVTDSDKNYCSYCGKKLKIIQPEVKAGGATYTLKQWLDAGSKGGYIWDDYEEFNGSGGDGSFELNQDHWFVQLIKESGQKGLDLVDTSKSSEGAGKRKTAYPINFVNFRGMAFIGNDVIVCGKDILIEDEQEKALKKFEADYKSIIDTLKEKYENVEASYAIFHDEVVENRLILAR